MMVNRGGHGSKRPWSDLKCCILCVSISLDGLREALTINCVSRYCEGAAAPKMLEL
jgi:hypothetical protein